MKKILLLTDFSKYASHASDFALAIASQTGSEILLFNSFYVSEILSPMEGVYPEVLEKSSMHDLELVAKELERKSQHRVRISYENAEGRLIENVNQILLTHNVWLIVMGEKSSGNLGHLFWSNHALDIIETTLCPVLMVPLNSAFNGFRRIAYALDENGTPVAALNYLKEMFQAFLSEIFIIHVKNHRSPIDLKNLDLLSEESDEMKISFFELEGDDTVAAIQHFIKEKGISVLVMQHFKIHSENQRSFTRSMLKINRIPILVIPAYLEA